MNKIIFFLSIAALSSCGTNVEQAEKSQNESSIKLEQDESKKEVNKPSTDTTSYEQFQTEEYDDYEDGPSDEFDLSIEALIGRHSGDFGKKKIEIFIESVNHDDMSIVGYNILDGNKRPLKGKFEYTDSPLDIRVILNEPGDDKWDGVFECILSESGLSGTWNSNNGKLSRDFELSKIN